MRGGEQLIRAGAAGPCPARSGRGRGQTFRLVDGRTARLATYYDAVAQRDLLLVWLIEEHDGQGTLNVIAVEHTG